MVVIDGLSRLPVGPSHLALFGYDPFRYEIGRGVKRYGMTSPMGTRERTGLQRKEQRAFLQRLRERLGS